MRPVAVLLALALAGCAAPDPSEVAPASVVAEASPGILRLDGPRAGPTLLAPPEWRTGDWWRVEVEDAFTGETRTVTKVVLGARNGSYLVGMPVEEWDGMFLSLHLPGFTEVSVGDFSTEVHDAEFVPVRFPLSEGATWDTGWHEVVSSRYALAATATIENATVARVSLEGPGGSIALVYDAGMRAISSFDFAGYGKYRVVEHGTGWTGEVKAAAGQDVVLLSQRLVAALGPPGLRPAPPVETIEVPAGYDEISVTLLAGTFLPPGSQVGAYRVEAIAPDGTARDLVVTSATSRGGLVGYAFEVPDPAGAWTVRHAALGPGTTLVEGLAYEVVRAEL